MVQRLVYRSRHSYAIKSKMRHIFKIQGRKLVYRPREWRPSNFIWYRPGCWKRMQEIPQQRSASELPFENKGTRLSRKRERIIRAFLVEEKMIVKKVLKLQKAKEKVAPNKA